MNAGDRERRARQVLEDVDRRRRARADQVLGRARVDDLVALEDAGDSLVELVRAELARRGRRQAAELRAAGPVPPGGESVRRSPPPPRPRPRLATVKTGGAEPFPVWGVVALVLFLVAAAVAAGVAQ